VANRHDVQIINYPKPDPPKDKPKADPAGDVALTVLVAIVFGIPFAVMVYDFWSHVFCAMDRYRCW
jgi:hypothetical protein